MPTKTYHKLVRDRIPEIIEADGKTCVCETLSDENYISLLDQKLNEELAEYQESKSLEELADLLEVICAEFLPFVNHPAPPEHFSQCIPAADPTADHVCRGLPHSARPKSVSRLQSATPGT